MAKRKTNIEFVNSIMEFSRHGAMAQVFVMQAIENYAKAVAAATPEQLDTPVVSGHVWHGCATEILAKLSEHYERPIAVRQKS